MDDLENVCDAFASSSHDVREARDDVDRVVASVINYFAAASFMQHFYDRQNIEKIMLRIPIAINTRMKIRLKRNRPFMFIRQQ